MTRKLALILLALVIAGSAWAVWSVIRPWKVQVQPAAGFGPVRIEAVTQAGKGLCCYNPARVEDGGYQAVDGACTSVDGAATLRDGAATLRDAGGGQVDAASTQRDGASTSRDGACTAHDAASTKLPYTITPSPVVFLGSKVMGADGGLPICSQPACVSTGYCFDAPGGAVYARVKMRVDGGTVLQCVEQR